MRKFLACGLSLALAAGALAQTPAQPQRTPEPEEEIVRIKTELVQVDAVVVDRNEQPVTDLKLSDFEVYENGKRQELQFIEFVSVDAPRRVEGNASMAARGGAADVSAPRAEMRAQDLRRVIAFVIDDLTIPYTDLVTVRQVLTDFVDNQMRDGDLVAIVRVVGGKGMLQQFTSDRHLLRRSIASLKVATNPFAAFNEPATGDNINIEREMLAQARAGGAGGAATDDLPLLDIPSEDATNPSNETNKLFRGLFSLTTASFVIDSLKQLPGRKSLVLVSGGVPLFETTSRGTIYSNVSYLLSQLTDKAVRAGVVINTMDPRGLKATPGVVGFRETPGRSGLSSPDPNFGRGGAELAVFGTPMAGAEQQISLATLAQATGGVSVVNTNNIKAGLDKVLARSRGYYLLAYRPTERFDKKFHRWEVKVKREGVRVYTHRGFVAREEEAEGARSKEQTILQAAQSPLARRDVEVSSNLTLRLSTANRAALDIDLVIDPKKLNFTPGADGKQQTSLDLVGFVYDEVGRLRGGFSQTLSLALPPETYHRTLKTGISYSASTELPPGYYQLRTVVREASTGNMGTTSRYLEVPDLSSGRLAMSSLLLYTVDPAAGASAKPELIGPARIITRTRELRYAATIFNAKRSNNQTQLRSQLIVSHGGRVLFREPEQAVAPASGPVATKVGQLGLSKVSPGRYLLTLVVTDPLADKKSQTVTRSAEFVVE